MREKSARVLHWIVGHKRVVALGVLALTAVAVPLAVMADNVSAGEQIGNFLMLCLAWLLQIFVGFIGTVLLLFIFLLILVAQYNGFVDAPAVTNGWSIVRDVTNMFFILVLLLIAFGTILGIDQYSYKNKRLSGLLIMAIVVNFTRTICGILIDFGQVVMLTFVFGFKEAAGGNFANAFQLKSLLKQKAELGSFLDQSSQKNFAFNLVVSLIMAMFALSIATAVVIYMTVMLVIRIIYLWLLIVISPLAFFLRAVPTSAASKYYGEWWSKFTSQIVFGPVMAFFLWLALVSVSGDQLMKVKPAVQGDAEKFDPDAITEFATSDVVFAYLIAICLMLGGAMMASQIAGSTAGMAKGITGKMGSGAVKAGKAVGGAAMNAKIPGTANKNRPEGLSLASLGGAAKQRFANSRLGQSSMFNKDKRDEIDKQRQISALEALGGEKGKEQAARMKKELITKGAGDMDKKMNSAQLRAEMDNEGNSQTRRQQAMLALAQRGDESLKGKGAALSGLAAGVGGSKDFELQVRQALKGSGDSDAMIKTADQAKNAVAVASEGEKKKMFEGIDKAVERGADGKMKQTHALDKLMALDEGDMKQFSARLKNQVSDALLKAAALEGDAGKRAEIGKKFKELTGADLTDKEAAGRTDELMTQMSQGQLADRVAKVMAGTATLAPIDRAANEMLAADPAAKRAEERIRNLQSRMSEADTDDKRTAIQGEMKDVMNELLNVGNMAAVNGKAPQAFDANGKALAPDEIIRGSQAFKDLEAASTTNDFKQAADNLKAAAMAMNQAPADIKQAMVQAVDQGKNSLTGLEGKLDNIKNAVKSEDRVREAKKLSSQGVATIEIMMKGGGDMISGEMKKELGELKQQLKLLGKAKAIDESQVREVERIRERLQRAKKKM